MTTFDRTLEVVREHTGGNLELTDAQADRQDAVVDCIHRCVNELVGREIEYDRDLICSVRDCIGDELEARNIMSWMEFYPYIDYGEDEAEVRS